MEIKRIVLNSGPTAPANPADPPVLYPLQFAELGISTDQNFVMVGTGTSSPNLIQTSRSSIVVDYSSTPGVIQRRYMSNPLSTPAAPAFQTNKKGLLPSGLCEPIDGEVGVVVLGVLIGTFGPYGLKLNGALTYVGDGGIVLSNGATTARPTTPQKGFIWVNNTLDALEWWDGDEWRSAGGGGGGGSLAPMAPVIANYTALAGDRLVANTSAGAFTITLPTSPANMAEIEIMGDFATNPVSIDPGPKKIARRAVGDIFKLNENDIGVKLVYDESLSMWRVWN